MGMKPKRRRLFFVLFGLGLLAAATALALTALEGSVLFFYTPSQVAEKKLAPGQRFRLGGLVAPGSRKKLAGAFEELFRVTDCKRTIRVHYKGNGPLPDLFREGQGVVAEGVMGPDGEFVATTVLAKHDENYMPKELADSLKKQGLWHKDKPGQPCAKT
jgi:cytochrome c-type biogenesis protein CcmE